MLGFVPLNPTYNYLREISTTYCKYRYLLRDSGFAPLREMLFLKYLQIEASFIYMLKDSFEKLLHADPVSDITIQGSNGKSA
jgi:hypothetical protein